MQAISWVGPLAIAAPWLTAWFTPLWILGTGVLIALAILGVAWLVLWAVRRTWAEAAFSLIADGLMAYIFWIAVALASLSLAGPLVVTNPGEMLAGMSRLNHTQWIRTSDFDEVAEVDGAEEPEIVEPIQIAGQMTEQTIPLAFRGEELRYLRLASVEPLLISSKSQAELAASAEGGGTPAAQVIEVTGVREYEWFRGANSVSPLGAGDISQLYVTNQSGFPTTLKLELRTVPVYPQMAMIPVTAISVVGLFAIYLGIHAFFPKLGAVALATSKSEAAQPLYIILNLLGFLLITIFVFIPYHTFGEDIKMLKDTGFTLILVFNLVFAIWAASSSVADEIEGRTALTVLSKPIGRAQFILGKYFGIMWAVLLMSVFLGGWLLVMVAYKPIYDARESSQLAPDWPICFLEMSRTIPGLVLAFMEVGVLTALSVAISTRLPLLANFVVCFVIYVLGHLTPSIVQSSLNTFEPVSFVAQLIATIFPMLDNFNIQAAVAADKEVPLHYLGLSFVYCMLYSLLAMLLALTLFEDRDLA